MWQLLEPLLKILGRVRLPLPTFRTKLVVGKADGVDALGGHEWRKFLSPRDLSAVWGPAPESPWYPFHCITLFTALDRLSEDSLGPSTQDSLPRGITFPSWLRPGTALFIDLDGVQSVTLAAYLAAEKPCEIISTFNNWPNAKGVLAPERILAFLLRYASLLHAKRVRPPEGSPVIWMCDGARITTSAGKPGQFDNRYYLDDSLLPGPKIMRENKITTVVYLHVDDRKINADLLPYFALLKKSGILCQQITRSAFMTKETPTEMKNIENPPTFLKLGFFRSSAGGFGAPVPHPSSGG